jgi:ferric-dicitrate binding protein FerR (iron transport regulator)
VVWSGRGRLELARGTIYIDRRQRAQSGASGTASTLEVRTPFGTVAEVGTQFELAVTAERLRARVREGAVAFSTGEERHLAAAGVELEWSAGTGVNRRAIESFGEPWSWTLEASPPIDLEGRTLDQALTWVARETGYRVAWLDPTLETGSGTERIIGTLVLRPLEAATLVPRLFGLDARVEAGTLTIADRADG